MVMFEVPVNPADFYEVEVGSRGTLSCSAAELEESKWYLEMSLGS
jgi:hypothetical protein